MYIYIYVLGEFWGGMVLRGRIGLRLELGREFAGLAMKVTTSNTYIYIYIYIMYIYIYIYTYICIHTDIHTYIHYVYMNMTCDLHIKTSPTMQFEAALAFLANARKCVPARAQADPNQKLLRARPGFEGFGF